jgi:hypothetical protein
LTLVRVGGLGLFSRDFNRSGLVQDMGYAKMLFWRLDEAIVQSLSIYNSLALLPRFMLY